MINILHVVSGSAEVGGTEEMIYLLCRYMDSTSFNHSLWTPFGTYDYLERGKFEGLINFHTDTSDPDELTRFLRDNNIDIALIHSGALNSLFAWPQIGAISSFNHLPLVEVMHRAVPSWSRYFRVDRIIAISKYVASLQPSNLHDIVEFVPNGIDLYPFQSPQPEQSRCRMLFGIPRHSTVIGFLGRLDEEKGPLDILRVASKIIRFINNTCFVFGGDGPLRQTIENEAATLNINALFFGIISPERKVQFLKSMDLIIIPSKTEAFCLVALEAMSAGVPLVSYDIEPIHEFFSDFADPYFLVPIKDTDKLAAAVINILGNEGERSRLSETCQKISKRFSIQLVAEQYGHILDDVMRFRSHDPVWEISAPFYRYLGIISLLKNDKENALWCFNSAVKLDPNLHLMIKSDVERFNEYVRQYTEYLSANMEENQR